MFSRTQNILKVLSKTENGFALISQTDALIEGSDTVTDWANVADEL